jgi:hypothetical protein
VVSSQLHGVIDFLGCGLVRRLCGILPHFLFHLQIDEAIFGAVIGCAVVVLTVWRFECVRPSATASTTVQWSTSLAGLCGSFIKISSTLAC